MRSMNKVILVGRLGRDVEVRHLNDGGRVATLSLATDESYKDRNTGDWVDRAEWHRVVTFQKGLIDILEKHAVKGRTTVVEGELRTRRWRKNGEDSDRFATEILISPRGQVQFPEAMPEGAVPPEPNGHRGNGGGGDLDDDIPF